ncbi:ATPase subunit 1 [Cucumis melo var. makuwa]|uniref:ATPase subunit 1 (Mitochondrion) n=1 Tax=Cucumis melo var. makuwa TaxID=1194695 RepID=A0A5A7UEG9_CUCMM|nr:ATPase subunit 1 [Cucumis melo var. makuwa]TYK12218.1 ATPase subunit 1 [Cucumis melo var. makuwa]
MATTHKRWWEAGAPKRHPGFAVVGIDGSITNFLKDKTMARIGMTISLPQNSLGLEPLLLHALDQSSNWLKGDGIAYVYGLKEIQTREMVEFVNVVKGIALNLENENVWIVVFGSDTAIKEGDLIKRIGSIMDIPARKVMLGRMVSALGAPIDGRGVFNDHKRRHIKVKALGIIERKSGYEPMKIGLTAVDI